MPIKPPECDYQNYDGHSYEEDKRQFAKLDGKSKARFSFPSSGFCIRSLASADWAKCANSPKRCDDCFRYSEYSEVRTK